MSSTTNKYRATFTLALRTISPSFSALHASRLRHHLNQPDERGTAESSPQAPPLTTLTCVQCGHASVRLRFVRLKSRKKSQKHRQRRGRPQTLTAGGHTGKGRGRDTVNAMAGDSNPYTGHTAARVLERTCETCAFVERMPAPRGAAAALFRSRRCSGDNTVRKTRRAASDTMRVGTTSSQPQYGVFVHDTSRSTHGIYRGGVTHAESHSASPAVSPVTPTPFIPTPVTLHPAPPTHTPIHTPSAAPKKRSKKKPGLQELLARNRARQRENHSAPGGLASFLDGL